MDGYTYGHAISDDDDTPPLTITFTDDAISFRCFLSRAGCLSFFFFFSDAALIAFSLRQLRLLRFLSYAAEEPPRQPPSFLRALDATLMPSAALITLPLLLFSPLH